MIIIIMILIDTCPQCLYYTLLFMHTVDCIKYLDLFRTANNVRDSTEEIVLLLLYYYYYAWLHCKYLCMLLCEKLSFAGCADKTTFFVIK